MKPPPRLPFGRNHLEILLDFSHKWCQATGCHAGVPVSWSSHHFSVVWPWRPAMPGGKGADQKWVIFEPNPYLAYSIYHDLPKVLATLMVSYGIYTSIYPTWILWLWKHPYLPRMESNFWKDPEPPKKSWLVFPIRLPGRGDQICISKDDKQKLMIFPYLPPTFLRVCPTFKQLDQCIHLEKIKFLQNLTGVSFHQVTWNLLHQSSFVKRKSARFLELDQTRTWVRLEVNQFNDSENWNYNNQPQHQDIGIQTLTEMWSFFGGLSLIPNHPKIWQEIVWCPYDVKFSLLKTNPPNSLRNDLPF